MEQAAAKRHVVIYTEGACSGNSGTGGWSCILKFGEHRKELSGFMQETTVHRMALFAAISGLGALKEPCRVTLYSDSAYLVDAFQNQRIAAWKRSNWMNENGSPVPDKDLWFILMAQTRRHDVRFLLLPEQSVPPEGMRCRELVKSAMEEWQVINSPHDDEGELMTDSLVRNRS